jgi:hypothetical protein
MKKKKKLVLEDETGLRGWMLSKPTKGAERAGEDARCWERFVCGGGGVKRSRLGLGEFPKKGRNRGR